MEMGIDSIFLFIVAISYAWGMRGSIIGGQKGAMLPGALIGIFFALFSGCAAYREYFYIFAAAGAAGIYFGGEMTYGQTLGFTMKGIKHKGFLLGMTGLFVKGFLWLGMCAGFLGITAAALSGEYYTAADIIIYSALLVPLFLLGSRLINRDPENGKMPKIYFSVTRGESWGGMLFIYVLTVMTACFRGNLFTVYFMLCVSFLSGVSWVIAQFLHVYTKKSPYIDNWKIMETVFGALIAVSFCVSLRLCAGSFREVLSAMPENGAVYQPLLRFDTQILLIWAALFALSAAYLFFKDPNSDDSLEKQRAQCLVTDGEYEKALRLSAGKRGGRAAKATESISDIFGFLAFGSIPLLAAAGAHTTAMVSCTFSLLWVLAEKTGWRLFNYRRRRNLIRAAMLAVCAAALAAAVFKGFSLMGVWLMYTVSYYFMQVFWLFRLSRIKQYRENGQSVLKQFGSLSSVQIYFTACVIIMLAGGFIVF